MLQILVGAKHDSMLAYSKVINLFLLHPCHLCHGLKSSERFPFRGLRSLTG